jgi:hypothetical protein
MIPYQHFVSQFGKPTILGIASRIVNTFARPVLAKIALNSFLAAP